MQDTTEIDTTFRSTALGREINIDVSPRDFVYVTLFPVGAPRIVASASAKRVDCRLIRSEGGYSLWVGNRDVTYFPLDLDEVEPVRRMLNGGE